MGFEKEIRQFCQFFVGVSPLILGVLRLRAHISQKVLCTCANEPAKSFNRLGGVGQRMRAFYGLRNRNQAILLIFYGC